jgi:hypothetical protein
MATVANQADSRTIATLPHGELGALREARVSLEDAIRERRGPEIAETLFTERTLAGHFEAQGHMEMACEHRRLYLIACAGIGQLDLQSDPSSSAAAPATSSTTCSTS